MTDRRIDRYVLEVLVSSRGNVQIWRAHDPALDRPVALLLLPADDPRASAVAVAARRAATVDERRLVAVLDVLDRAALVSEGTPDTSEYLVVVDEWVEGRTLTDIQEEREGEPIDAAEALPLVRQVAIAMRHSHEAGVRHERLRPAALLIAETADLSDPFSVLGDINVVRIRGLAVDAALWEAEALPALPNVTDAPDVDPDVHGTGCLLYAMVTGRWPEGLVDGMSPAPRANGRLLPPSQVVADVPAAVDEICLRAIDPRVSGEWPPRKGRTPYADMSALVSALGALSDRTTASGRRSLLLATRDSSDRELTAGRRALRAVGRVAAAAAALIVVAGIGVLGLRMANGAQSPWGIAANPVPSEVLTATGAVAGGQPLEPGAVAGEILVVNAQDFDPYGPDKEEMPDSVPAAIDAKGDSAWMTDTYSAPNLDGKKGVGLLLDLGTAQPVSAVRLELVGAGSSVQVRIASEILPKPKNWTLLAEAQAIGTAIDLRAPRPIVGRYVLIWFTQLPPNEGAYQGGVRDVTVFS